MCLVVKFVSFRNLCTYSHHAKLIFIFNVTRFSRFHLLCIVAQFRVLWKLVNWHNFYVCIFYLLFLLFLLFQLYLFYMETCVFDPEAPTYVTIATILQAILHIVELKLIFGSFNSLKKQVNIPRPIYIFQFILPIAVSVFCWC